MWYNREAKKSEDQRGLPKGEFKSKFEGVSIGKDKDGFYCYTHRCRSDSYDSLKAIPESVVKFIESTG